MESNLTDTQILDLEKVENGISEIKNRVPMVSLKTIENIIMKKYAVCQIFENNYPIGSGFFCKIKFGNKKMKVLLTNNHVFNPNNNDEIHLKIMNEEKIIQITNNNRFFCTNENKELDYTCIEILKEDDINHFFKIDYEKDRKDYKNIFYWSIHFCKKEEPQFSIAQITNIIEQTNKTTEYGIIHSLDINFGSSGSPIVTYDDNCNVIGIHKSIQNKEEKEKLSFGTFINDIIIDIEEKYKEKYFPDKGIIECSNGNKYEGELKNGLKEGKGIMYYKNGNKYDGEWKNGLKEGKGIMYYKNGNKYDGEWKNDIIEGKGIYYSNENKFEGEWKNDLKEGFGLIYYNNGNIYIGE